KKVDYGNAKVPSLGGIPLLALWMRQGMDTYYYGIHPQLKIEVGLKVLPLHLANPEMVRRWCSEAKMAARVISPHFVKLKDAGEECGLFYMVMEFVNGPTAGSHLKKVKDSGAPGLTEAEALDTCIAASEGLAALHKEGIINRDIKPAKILIPKVQGRQDLDFKAAKLFDLGYAHDEVRGDSGTLGKGLLGTPAFMAPEQAMDVKNAHKPADVFSIGATLYALLSGQPPFKGQTALQVLAATQKDPHTPLCSVRPDVSSATAALVDRCLAKDPAARYADGPALLAALKECRAALGH
ncbi:MAG: serine/threonine-protein kinase, partial [Planctomycetota bacterium]